MGLARRSLFDTNSVVVLCYRNERLASIEGASDQHQDRVSGAIESSEPLMVTLNEQVAPHRLVNCYHPCMCSWLMATWLAFHVGTRS